MGAKTQKSKKIRDSWVQFDTLCCGTGWDEDDLKNPQILVEDVIRSCIIVEIMFTKFLYVPFPPGFFW